MLRACTITLFLIIGSEIKTATTEQGWDETHHNKTQKYIIGGGIALAGAGALAGARILYKKLHKRPADQIASNPNQVTPELFLGYHLINIRPEGSSLSHNNFNTFTLDSTDQSSLPLLLHNISNSTCTNTSTQNTKKQEKNIINHLKASALGHQKNFGGGSAYKKIADNKGIKTTLEIDLDALNETSLSNLEKKHTLSVVSALTIKTPNSQQHVLLLTEEHISLIARYFLSLNSLTIRGILVDTTSFCALAKSRIASILHDLSLEFETLALEILQPQIFTRFSRLRALSLSVNCLNKINFKALAKSTLAPLLRTLIIKKGAINSSCFTTELFDQFKQLEILSMLSIPLGNSGFNALAQSELAPHLYELRINGEGITRNNFTDEGLSRFKSIKKLSISHIESPQNFFAGKFDKFSVQHDTTNWKFTLNWSIKDAY